LIIIAGWNLLAADYRYYSSLNIYGTGSKYWSKDIWWVENDGGNLATENSNSFQYIGCYNGA
jgi:hypothetical protein